MPEATPSTTPDAGAPAATAAGTTSNAFALALDTVSAVAADANVVIKVYGDADAILANGSKVSPSVVSFGARRFELFPTAEAGRVSFLAEFLAEVPSAKGPGGTLSTAQDFGFDVERLELTYLFNNYLRVRLGRSHLAMGYYNDSFHHGKIFELTTGRPYIVNFEDTNGLIMAHVVGMGADGTFETSTFGSFRYDFNIGNSHPQDVTGVSAGLSEAKVLTENLRLRWMPFDDFIFGINGMHSSIPACPANVLGETGGPALCPAVGAPDRPQTDELIGGVHVVYLGYDVHFITEAYVISHTPQGGGHQLTYGGFSELGYAINTVTPYFRGEYIRFPDSGDTVYQAPDSLYANTLNFSDLRVGVRWQPIPQIAAKLEGQRYYVGGTDHELAMLQIAFGF
ncbi:MAG TPA: hypothetical protein VGM06_01520 [Polyangiaceae bacterium]